MKRFITLGLIGILLSCFESRAQSVLISDLIAVFNDSNPRIDRRIINDHQDYTIAIPGLGSTSGKYQVTSNGGITVPPGSFGFSGGTLFTANFSGSTHLGGAVGYRNIHIRYVMVTIQVTYCPAYQACVEPTIIKNIPVYLEILDPWALGNEINFNSRCVNATFDDAIPYSNTRLLPETINYLNIRSSPGVDRIADSYSATNYFHAVLDAPTYGVGSISVYNDWTIPFNSPFTNYTSLHTVDQVLPSEPVYSAGEVKPLPAISAPAAMSYCIATGDQELPSASPSYGAWSGPQVYRSGGKDYVRTGSLSAGSYTIYYGAVLNSCYNESAATLTINPRPGITMPGLGSVCVSASAYILPSPSPAGGTWSGPGVTSGSTFNPGTAGVGTHTLTYSYTDGNGCSNSSTAPVTVNALPTVNAGSDNALCLNNGLYTLVGTPAGGSWSGTGVSGNTFNPATAGTGNTTVTYTYTDGNGCTNSDSRVINVRSLPSVDAGINRTLCVNDGGFNLSSDDSPNGGTWSGTGVSGGIFYPSSAGVGVHTLTYTYTDSGTGCTNSDTKQMTVNAIPSVTVSPTSQAVCVNNGSFTLTGGSPVGGSWSGTGVSSGSTFNPATAGVGTHTLTYSYTNASGCTSTATRTMVVNGTTSLTLPPATDTCDDSGNFVLSATPSGGTWSGSSYLSGNNFNTDAAPPANYSLTYTYTNASGCTSSGSFTLTVRSLPNTNAGSDRSFCVDDAIFSLGGSPTGGTWSGPGVSASSFNPSVAGVGTHTLIYSSTNVYGCTKTDQAVYTVNPLPTVNAGSDFTVCTDEGLINLTGTPTGGTWSGPGVSSNRFNPLSTGTGNHIITYTYTNPTTGCSNFDTRMVTVYEPPVVDPGPDLLLCRASGTYALTDATPVGGVWSGDNMTGNVFDSNVPADDYDVYYTYTDPFTGCSVTEQRTVTVINATNVNAGNDQTVCVNTPVFSFSGYSPLGGTWTSTNPTTQAAISGETFNPAIAGIGNHTLRYFYTDANGCQNSDTRLINVVNLPNVDAGLDRSVCLNGSPINITSQVTPGGTWSGPGVSNGVFNPSSVGVGSYILTYTVTDGFSCVNSDQINMTVYPTPVVNAGFNLNVCINDAMVDLTDATPVGGTWSGKGIQGTNFNPALAGTGTHTLTYSYTSVNGCTATATRTATVFNITQVEAGSSIQACYSDSGIPLVGQPTGGTWSGIGVSSNIFSPAAAGVGGPYTLTYSYTNINGCISTDTKFVTVLGDPVVEAGANASLCTNDGLYNLNIGASPTGGVWSGNGVSGNSFNPATSGAGSHIITYTYTNAAGCDQSDTKSITVITPVPVTVGVPITFCISDPTYDLMGDVSISGGTFSGPGVVGSNFVPSLAGPGTHSVVYTTPDGNGCNTTATRTVYVVGPANVDAGQNVTLCAGSPSIDLADYASPAGGVFSGTGVSGSTFDPDLVAAGVYQITYTVTDAFGCSNSDKVTITVSPALVLTATSQELCANGEPIDLNTVVSQPGGTFTGPGVRNSLFNPSDINPGTYVISYNYSNSFGCSDDVDFTITVTPLPVVTAGSDMEVCANQTPIDLMVSAVPQGGIFEGAGVTGQRYFDPQIAGIGRHDIFYTYTNAKGCSVTESREIEVSELPNIKLTKNKTVCISAPVIDLDEGITPLGGTWSGTGVTVSNFSPLLAGVGVHTLTYTYVESTGCSNSASLKITVTEPDPVTVGGPLTLCGNDDVLDLNLGISPLGGTWTGQSVSSGRINPKNLNPGTYTYTYEYNHQNGCVSRAERIITIAAPPTIVFSDQISVCKNQEVVNLSDLAVPSTGTWTGGGVAGNTFDPKLTGVGKFTLTYTVASGIGCTTVGEYEITVTEPPTVTIGGNVTVCINSEEINLFQTASKPGGNFTGNGVLNGQFIPSTAGIGSHLITYKVAGDNGCSSTAYRIITVTQAPEIQVGSALSVCKNGSLYNLMADVSHQGGSWSGPGVSSNQFDPSKVSVGSYQIQYSYNASNGCTAYKSRTVTVYAAPTVSAGPALSMCSGDPVINLAGSVFPSGGTFFGPGISGSQFNPEIAGVGTHTISYEFTNVSGCTSAASKTITVTAPPVVNAGNNLVVCLSDNAVDLSSGVTPNGIWSGVGLSGFFFSPVAAGVGTHTLTYTVDYGANCVASKTRVITVVEPPAVDAGANLTLCMDGGSYNLVPDGSVPGGIWSGVGVSNGVFNPATSGQGVFTISYQITGTGGCKGIDSRTITVVSGDNVYAGPAISVCIAADPLTLYATPSGGTWQGAGIDGGFFNPVLVGAGTHTVTYSIIDSNGCKKSSSKTITVTPLPVVNAGQDLQFCISPNGIDLSTTQVGLTAGGYWSGTGIVNNKFYPSSAGVGSHTIRYTLPGSCSSYDEITIDVQPAQTVDSGQDLILCATDGPVDLVQSGLEGTYTGFGVVNNIFFPANTGTGTFIINYSNVVGSCQVNDTRQIKVVTDPAILVSSAPKICLNSGSYELSRLVSPNTGLWSGPGVSGTYFDPTATGIGKFNLSYTYFDGNGCIAEAIQSIEVIENPVVNIGTSFTMCISDLPVNIRKSVKGGNFTGTAIIGDLFYPALAGPGTHTVNYSKFENGCFQEDSYTIEVYTIPTVSLPASVSMCVDDGVFDLSSLPNTGGGTWSGTAVDDNNFDPSDAGPGSFTLKYEVSNQFGCKSSAQTVVKVIALPTVTVGPAITACVAETPVDLTISTTAGGIWSGPGVSGPLFDPSVAGVGAHTLTYTLENPVTGCSKSVTRIATVTALPALSAGSNFTVCENALAVDLSLRSGVTAGGTWSGDAVNGVFFYPNLATNGVNEVVYTLDKGKGCVVTKSLFVTVNGEIALDIGEEIEFCINDPGYDLLFDVNLVGGDFSGPGVTGSVFNPSRAGVGSFIITYEYESLAGCVSSASRRIVVKSPPVVVAGANLTVCYSDELIDLRPGTSPSGGSFFSSGLVDDYFFNPKVAGAGKHNVTYSFTNTAGCTTEVTREIEVLTPPVVFAGPALQVCINAEKVDLSASVNPKNGSFSGPGVNGSYFYPASAGLGTHEITYSITTANGCVITDTREISVNSEATLDVGTDLQLCQSDAPYDLLLDVNILGGTWSGKGITNNLFRADSAGVGLHILTYNVATSDGCDLSKSRIVRVNQVQFLDLPESINSCTDGDVINLLAGFNSQFVSVQGPGVDKGRFYPDQVNPGIVEVKYSFLNQNGCTSTQTLKIIVQGNVFVSTDADFTVCKDVGQIDLSDSAIPAGGVWSGTGIRLNTFNALTAGLGTHALTYTVDNGNGCMNADTLRITVIDSDITNFGSDTLVCINSPEIILNFNSQLGAGSWSGTGVVNNIFYPGIAKEGVFTVKYSNSSYNCDVVGQRIITVIGLPPKPQAVENRINGCIGDVTRLEAFINNNESNVAVNYLWFREGVNEPFDEGKVIDFVIEGSENIYYTTANQYGCRANELDFIRIVATGPSGDFAVDKDTVNIGELIRFTANSANANAFRWELGDGNYSTEKNPSYFYYNKGWKEVKLTMTSADGCDYTIIKENFVYVLSEEDQSGRVTGVQDKEPVFKVYPNPIENEITVESESVSFSAIKVFTLDGKKVSSFDLAKPSLKAEVDASSLNRGVYFLLIEFSNGQLTYKKVFK